MANHERIGHRMWWRAGRARWRGLRARTAAWERILFGRLGQAFERAGGAAPLGRALGVPLAALRRWLRGEGVPGRDVGAALDLYLLTVE